MRTTNNTRVPVAAVRQVGGDLMTRARSLADADGYVRGDRAREFERTLPEPLKSAWFYSFNNVDEHGQGLSYGHSVRLSDLERRIEKGIRSVSAGELRGNGDGVVDFFADDPAVFGGVESPTRDANGVGMYLLGEAARLQGDDLWRR